MIIVFKLSDNVKNKVIDYYEPLKREKTPPYAIFQADEGGTIITLYSSGKIMFQGISADIDANLWIDMEKHLNNRTIDIEEKENKKEEEKDLRFINISTIGSDEVGTGDYFGPIVVTASFVDKSNILFMQELGVRDSKKINDEKIMKIAPLLIKKIPYVTYILDNKSYNANYKFDLNMNRIKSILHNKVLCTLINKDKYNYDKIVVDQFVYPKKYFEHLKMAKEICKNITFTTHAEDKCYSVAASSIISRYIFIKEMDKLSKKYNMIIPKGAGTIVDSTGVKIVKQYGFSELENISKLNFKNTEKIKSSL